MPILAEHVDQIFAAADGPYHVRLAAPAPRGGILVLVTVPREHYRQHAPGWMPSAISTLRLRKYPHCYVHRSIPVFTTR